MTLGTGMKFTLGNKQLLLEHFFKSFILKFELRRSSGTENLLSMEGLRGFAVFLVFLVHYSSLIKPWIAHHLELATINERIQTIGNTGVDLFFVLSGYLIYNSLIIRPQRFSKFMFRRIKRIYPVFIIVFAIYVALSFALPKESKIPTSLGEGIIYIILNLLLLPGLFPVTPVITVAWSLSYEIFYYITIPIIITLFRLRERSAAWRIYFFLVFAAMIIWYCAIYGGHPRLIMFISGIMLHEALESHSFPFLGSWSGFTALVLGMSALLIPVNGDGGETFKICILFASFFVLCFVCFNDYTSFLSKIFSWAPLRWLGNMSYSYYLFHGLTLKIAFFGLAIILPPDHHKEWLFGVLLPMMFALTLLTSSILFLVIERPFSLSSASSVIILNSTNTSKTS
jgi:peptidoglycan/LPS O-acetylase OafA/YrhL